MNNIRTFTLLLLATVLVAQGSNAQVPSRDPSTRLREVLPADVAQRVLARIADARARQLPAAALENRALKFAARVTTRMTTGASKRSATIAILSASVTGSSKA